MKIIYIFIILMITLSSCTIGTTNKITTNQYPCDTDSVGNKLQNVNIYLEKPKQNK